MRRSGRRTVQAAAAADVVAAQFKEISSTLLQTSPHFEAGVVALREVLAYMETVKAEVDAAAGHAAEGAMLAADHAHELAQVATVVSNLPELDGVDETIAGRYTLPDGATEAMLERVLLNLEADIRRAAGSGGITFELVARDDD